MRKMISRLRWQVLAEHGRGGFVEGGGPGRGALAGKLKKGSKWKHLPPHT